MRQNRWLWMTGGAMIGVLGAVIYLGQLKPAYAANDRYEDYILCTGAVSVSPRSPTDGVWLLDYRSGKLLGTVIDRTQGKIIGWAEVDLTTEFGIPPRQNVHFLMTTGSIALGQAALYVAETTTGKFAVYTMAPRTDGQQGMGIRRHDMVMFRQPPKVN
jgi:hypothetical protein